MNQTDYRTECLKTESIIDQTKPNIIGIFRQGLRITSRFADFMDLLKKAMFYNRPIENRKLIAIVEDVQSALFDLKGYLLQHSPEGTVQDLPTEVTDISYRASHAILGIVTEAGELSQALENIFSSKDGSAEEVNPEALEQNIAEEISDLMWYQECLMDACNLDPDKLRAANIAKLRRRMGGASYSEAGVTNRDTTAEMAEFNKALK